MSTNGDASTKQAQVSPFPPPALPHGKAQWHHEQLHIEYAVMIALHEHVEATFAPTDKEYYDVVNATAPIAAQIRREVCRVLRKHRRTAQTVEGTA